MIINKIQESYIRVLQSWTFNTWKNEIAWKHWKKITKDKNGENVPHLEITKVVLVHCYIVNNDYQQNSRVLYTYIPNKLFGSLLEISPANHIFLKAFNSEFQEIKVRFTDQNSQPLEIKDRTNLTLVIKYKI